MEKNLFGRIAGIVTERYRIIYLIIFILFFWGIMSHEEIPKEIFPEVKFPYGIIIIEYPGASPKSVERNVTNKIELAISGVGDIKKITSESSQGTSMVIVKFDENVDISEKITKLQTEVNNKRGDLPSKIQPPVIQEYDINDFPIMLINISGNYNLSSIRDYAFDIKNKIEKISGVKKIKVIGGKEEKIEIAADQKKMKGYGVSNFDIKNGISSNNMATPLGEHVLDGINYSVKTNNEYVSLQDIERTIVGTKNGYPIFIKDLADVKKSYKKQESFAFEVDCSREGFRSEIVYLAIYKKKNTDTVAINRDIRTYVDDGRGILYPRSLNISYVSDMSKYINKSLGDVFGNASTGLLCVIIVLFLFINFKESLIAAFVIPLSLLITVITFKYLNISYNVLSAMGLIMALGMLVDNAIVLIESINMNKKNSASIKEAANISVNEVGSAIFSSTLTTIGAFLPLALLSGEDGKLIKIIPITAIIAMIASFIVSITVTPTLCSRFLDIRPVKLTTGRKMILLIIIGSLSLFAFSDNGEFTILSIIGFVIFTIAAYIKLFKKSVFDISNILIRYEKFLRSMINFKNRRRFLFAMTLIIFMVSIILMVTVLPMEAMPITDNTTIYGDIGLPKGSTIDDSKSTLEEIEKILMGYGEIETCIEELSNEKIFITIELVKKDERDIHSKYIMNSLRKELKKIPGISSKITNPDSEEEGAPIVIEIRGENLKFLEKYAHEYKKILEGINGMEDVNLSTDYGIPQLNIEYYKGKLAMNGLSPSDLDYSLWNIMNEEKISKFIMDDKELDIVLKLKDEDLNEKNDFSKVIFSSEGSKIPFNSIAKISEVEGIDKIKHTDGKRTIRILGVNNPKVTVSDILREFKNKIEKSDYKANEEIEVFYTGYFEKMNESYSDMKNKMILALIVVYAILVAQFNSFGQPFIIMLSVPLAITGVVFGHLMLGIKFSTLSFMGVISLTGIAVNDAIVLIDSMNQLRRKNEVAFKDAIVEAGKSRFIPVIATSITTIGGVLSLALYNEDYCQMAYTLIFGLFTSTILILLIVPVVYFVLENSTGNKKREGRI